MSTCFWGATKRKDVQNILLHMCINGSSFVTHFSFLHQLLIRIEHAQITILQQKDSRLVDDENHQKLVVHM